MTVDVWALWVEPAGWNFPPTVVVGCAMAAVLYVRGARSTGPAGLRAPGQDGPMEAGAAAERAAQQRWRTFSFLGGLLVFVVAVSSPIDRLAQLLFWVHMTQHLLLWAVVAPLVVLGAPWQPVWRGLPGSARRALSTAATRPPLGSVCKVARNGLRRPAVCYLLFVAGTWLWHLPALFDLALRNPLVHEYGEHLTFLVVGVILWSQIIGSPPLQPTLGYAGRVAYVGAVIVQNVALAMIIGFAPVPLYAPYAHLLTRPGGISALADQRIGAGIMWTAGDLPFSIAISLLVQRWFAQQERAGRPTSNFECPGIP